MCLAAFWDSPELDPNRALTVRIEHDGDAEKEVKRAMKGMASAVQFSTPTPRSSELSSKPPSHRGKSFSHRDSGVIV